VKNMDVFSELIAALKKERLIVTAAESCTAGLFSAMLAGVPGASDVFWGGFVTYSVDAKRTVLGVSPETVSACGVVSEPTAREMAAGAAKKASAGAAVAITGFAGPSADDGFPVGRVCFGFFVRGALFSETVEFGDLGRNVVRERSAVHAAERLLGILEKESCI
jgi:nicotinamide-nucleotide amidase